MIVQFHINNNIPLTLIMEEISLCQYKVRGLAEPIKMMLKYLHVPYDIVYPDSPEFVHSLDFLNFPAIRDNSTGLEISCSIAACKYLAGKYRPKMLGSAMNEFAEVDSLLYNTWDIHKIIVEDLYERMKYVNSDKVNELIEKPIEPNLVDEQNIRQDEDVAEEIKSEETKSEETKSEENKSDENDFKISEQAITKIKSKLAFVERYLRGRNWLVGKQPSIADFFFIELMNFLDWIDPKDGLKTKFPRIKNLIRKFYLIPEMAEYKKTQSDFDLSNLTYMLKEL